MPYFTNRGIVPLSVGGGGAVQTWDPANIGSHISLSSGDLVATAGSGATLGDGARGLVSRSSGQVYWEIAVTSDGGGSGCGPVVVDSIFTVGGSVGADPHAIIFFNDSFIYYNSANIGSLPASPTTGDVVSLALDIGTKKLWLRINAGSWYGPGTNVVGDPVAGTNGIDLSAFGSTFYPYVELRGNGVIFTANFGATAYAFTKPVGYVNWV
jgi:hypothetical protein